jgi:hypothetical protein
MNNTEPMVSGVGPSPRRSGFVRAGGCQVLDEGKQKSEDKHKSLVVNYLRGRGVFTVPRQLVTY